ncbi:MAG: hypothetical protein M3347_18955, partial [Armatimonadota bacterium]|nr:hypothetical protein [Armatimonadota bacterium]
MAKQVDLNELRRTIIKNQQQGVNLPTQKDRQIVVDKEGNVKLGRDVEPGEERSHSVVHQATFAALGERLAREQQTVNLKFPSNTQFLQVDGIGGWLYKVVNEFGEPYE